MSDKYNLNRFVNAQDKTHPTIQYSYYEISCNEIENGKKMNTGFGMFFHNIRV